MLSSPYELVACSWPRPADVRGTEWKSEPEWDAPAMTPHPECSLEWIDGCWRWTLDWNTFLHAGLCEAIDVERDLIGFHAVWRLRIRRGGVLVVPGAGSCIRRDGAVVHCQRSLVPHGEVELRVIAGELLEVAQLHGEGRWRWWAYLQGEATGEEDPAVEVLRPYLTRVQGRLRRAAGPPLKVFTDGTAPVRLAVAVYSLILNGGYEPAAVYVFGEHQWDERTRTLVQRLLPFAQVVDTMHVLAHLQELGGPKLTELVGGYPEAMKAAMARLYPPSEFCALDDDVLVLDRVDDAIQAFHMCNHVVTLSPTRRAASVLYWYRSADDPCTLAEEFLSVPLQLWERGLAGPLLTRTPPDKLAAHRYIHAIAEGLPGGPLGYNYAANPCRFAAISLSGLESKDQLTDGRILPLIEGILGAV